MFAEKDLAIEAKIQNQICFGELYYTYLNIQLVKRNNLYIEYTFALCYD